jgi:competence protein ComEC
MPSGSEPEALAGIAQGSGVLFARPRDITLIDSGSELERARSGLRTAFRQALARIGRKSAGLLQALVLGVRDSLAPDEAEAFKMAGCAHILALSGEHLSVIALLAIAALKPLAGPIRARLGGAILAGLFMWVVGPGPSLLRAVLMAWIGAVALALDRPQDWLTVLSLAFLATLPFDPQAARGVSYTLSYLAVWGLAVLGPRFAFFLGRALPPFLRRSASASLAAQAALSPLLASTFGYLQFAGVPASMAAGPLVTLIMWWGMGAGLLCSIFPSARSFAIPISDLLYDLLMAVMRTAASVPVLRLDAIAAKTAASFAVACLTALVYARPYVEYRAWACQAHPARLRLAPGPQVPPRGRRARDEQALRPELPDR